MQSAQIFGAGLFSLEGFIQSSVRPCLESVENCLILFKPAATESEIHSCSFRLSSFALILPRENAVDWLLTRRNTVHALSEESHYGILRSTADFAKRNVFFSNFIFQM